MRCLILNVIYMVNQKLISFKIDEELLPLLDQLSVEYGLKRNTMLNVLVRTGVSCLNDKKAKYAIMAALQSVSF